MTETNCCVMPPNFPSKIYITWNKAVTPNRLPAFTVMCEQLSVTRLEAVSYIWLCLILTRHNHISVPRHLHSIRMESLELMAQFSGLLVSELNSWFTDNLLTLLGILFKGRMKLGQMSYA